MKTNKLERAFINHLVKLSEPSFVDIREDLNLLKRKYQINNQFRLTNSRVNQLKKINNLFIKKEKQLIKSCNSIEKYTLSLIKQSKYVISDYEIRISIDYYSDEISKRYPEFEFDYVYCDDFNMMYTKKEFTQNEPNNNWIGFVAPKSLRTVYEKMDVCRTLFNLIEYSYLSLQDIMLISDAWYDIKVVYQFHTEIK